jgi:hypothetical protein
MTDAIDRQRMIDAIYPIRDNDMVINDDDEIDLLCENREYAISVASIQTILTQDGDLEKRCIDPMAMARLGRMQRKHRDKNRGYIETGFVLVDGVTY